MLVAIFNLIGIFSLVLNSGDHLKLKGYDPVAYFTMGKPVKGDTTFKYKTAYGTFLFSSQTNLELFKQTPEKSTPQYGGYCAYAVSKGYTAPVDPEAFDIVKDKLYLNYSKAVQKKWRENRDNYIAAADKNWPAIKIKEEKKTE